MQESTVRNFHVPLPEELYDRLRREAARAKQPATVLARQAIEQWLKPRRKAALHREIANYAANFAGSETDLDQELEAAALAHWRDQEERQP